MFEIKICDNYEQVSKAAFEVLKGIIEKKERPVLGLATGSSPIGLYQEMINDYKNGYSYRNCITFNLDEYVGIPLQHSQSYWTFMHENLFNFIDVDKSSIHIPSAQGEDLQKLCDAYEQDLSNYKIDIQVLGIGSNGHIGFNEPGTSFDSTTHIVSLQEQTRLDNARFFDSLDDVPTKAITMGIASIMTAKHILIIATGEKKAKAIQAMIEGPITTDCPASILQKHPSVSVVLDKAAASLLGK